MVEDVNEDGDQKEHQCKEHLKDDKSKFNP